MSGIEIVPYGPTQEITSAQRPVDKCEGVGRVSSGAKFAPNPLISEGYQGDLVIADGAFRAPMRSREQAELFYKQGIRETRLINARRWRDVQAQHTVEEIVRAETMCSSLDLIRKQGLLIKKLNCEERKAAPNPHRLESLDAQIRSLRADVEAGQELIASGSERERALVKLLQQLKKSDRRARGWKLKAQRQIACGLFGMQYDAEKCGRAYFRAFRCRNRYCPICGPHVHRRLLAKYLDLQEPVADYLATHTSYRLRILDITAVKRGEHMPSPENVRKFKADVKKLIAAVNQLATRFSISMGGRDRSDQRAAISPELYTRRLQPKHPEAPLPGRGLDTFISDTLGSLLGDLSSGMRSGVNTTIFGAELAYHADEMALNASVRPVVGFLGVVGGVSEMVGGGASAFGSAGIAAVPGVALALHGLDTAVASFRIMLGEDATSYTHDAFESLVGPKYAGVAEGVSLGGLGAVAGLVNEVGGPLSRLAQTEAAGARIELSETISAARTELSQSMQLRDVKSIGAVGAEIPTEYSAMPRSQPPTGSTGWSADRVEMGGPGQLTRITALENDIEVGYGSNYTRIGNDPATMRVTEVRETWPNTHDLVVHSETTERNLSPGFLTNEAPYWDVMETHVAQIAETLNMNPNLQPGQPIRALACALNPEQAQQLANLTGHPIYASPFVVGVPGGSGTMQIEQFIRYDFGAARWSQFAETQVWHLFLPEWGQISLHVRTLRRTTFTISDSTSSLKRATLSSKSDVQERLGGGLRHRDRLKPGVVCEVVQR